jgi:preprotein translocase subunit SecD
MHPLRALAGPALVLLLGGAQVGDDPKPAPSAKRADLPTHFRKLGLTNEQVAQVAKVQAKYDAKVKELEEKIKAAREDEAAEVEKLLNDAQRDRLKELRQEGKARDAVRIEFRRAETEPGEGVTEATAPGTKKKVYLHKESEITNEDIADATIDLVSEDLGEPGLELTFTKEGQKKLAKLTTEHQGKPLAILVDGKLLTAPTVRTKLEEKAYISGGLKKAEVERIVNGLKREKP